MSQDQQSLKLKTSKDSISIECKESSFYEIKIDCGIRGNGTGKFLKVSAIWDTGATRTVIANRIADKLKLIPCDQGSSIGTEGCTTSSMYMIDFVLPNGKGIGGLKVFSSSLPEIDVLIGLDIICLGNFSISSKSNGEGCIFSFRIPAQEDGVIDYTEK